MEMINMDKQNPYKTEFIDNRFIVTEEVIVNEYPEFSYVNLADFYYYPDAQVIADSSVIAERIKMTQKEIEALADEEVEIKESWLAQNKWKVLKDSDPISVN